MSLSVSKCCSLFGCNSEDSKETEHGIRNEGVRTAQGVKASNKDWPPTQTDMRLTLHNENRPTHHQLLTGRFDQKFFSEQTKANHQTTLFSTGPKF